MAASLGALIDQLIVDVLIVAVVLICVLLGGAGLVILAVPLGICGLLAVFPGYYTFFHGKDGRTLGKRALGIYVGDAAGGYPIGYGRAFGRWCAQFLLIAWLAWIVIPFVLNYLWPLWDDQHQCWHDKIVSSSVFRSVN